MQPRPTPSKPKYKIKDFAAAGNYAVNKYAFVMGDGSCKLYCVCNQYSLAKSRKCTRCGESFHTCVTASWQNSKDWECLRCESKYMDPIYVPQQILLETFFKTQTIYQVGNQFQFLFNLTAEQLKNPVEIRGLQDGRSGLAWPMHGQFFVNNEYYPESIIDFKPLLKNSNRYYFAFGKTKGGKEFTYICYTQNESDCLRSQISGRRIYAIKKLSKQQLIQKTFQTSKIDKPASLELLKNLTSTDNQLTVQKIKLCLQCPYMKSRIKIPIRGRKCKHYMCICLDTLIQTRASLNSREWLCPICNADINQPVIDMFILSILNDGSAGIEVMLNVNGKYQWQAFQDDDMSILSSEQNNQRLRKIQKQKQAQLQLQSQKTPEPSQQSQSLVKSKIMKPPEKQKQKQKQKSIQMINLDDDDDVVIQPTIPNKNSNSNSNSKANITSNAVSKSSTVAKKRVAPFQIMVPQQAQGEVFNRQKQSNQQKQKIKQKLKTSLKRRQNSTNPTLSSSTNKNIGSSNSNRNAQYMSQGKSSQYSQQESAKRNSSNKVDLYIKDVKNIEFKMIGHSDYLRKYFMPESNSGSGVFTSPNGSKSFSMNNLSEDLRIIFKEVIF